jgi:hypothetical protein
VYWTERTSGGGDLYGVAYGNGTFVAVGECHPHPHLPGRGEWTPQPTGTSSILYGVTYGNGLFVAVGGSGTILTSPDGVSWTRASLGDEQLTSTA